MPTKDRQVVHVRPGARGEWKVLLPDQRETARLETLDDATRVAHLCAAHRHPCELIVQDAYRRVLRHEFIDGAGSWGPASCDARHRG